MIRKTTRPLAPLWLTLLPVVAMAGTLEPAGPPAPTMKSLDEVRPHIPVHSSDLPMTISAPGTYYAVENLTTATIGFNIQTSGVTIDLMGFTLTGGNDSGIVAGSTESEIVVKNGTITGFDLSGMQLQSANTTVVEVQATGNGSYGIFVGPRSRVLRSLASGNYLGIHVGEGSLVQDCVSVVNERDGITARSGSVVRGNVASHNGTEGNIFSAGIAVNNVTWTDVRIEGNHVVGNPRGLRVVTTGNQVIRNSASGNTIDYDVAAGNDLGPIGSAAASTSPWANIQF